MGQTKQLMTIHGEPLLARTVKVALLASPYVTVVLGSQADIHRRLLDDFAVHIVDNPAWSKGMGGSLKEGLASVRRSHPPADAILVMLCDQPGITAAHIGDLINRAGSSTKRIIASAYHETQGVPALFKKEMFDALAEIDDQTGASKLIRRSRHDMEAVPFPDAAIDLDTPQDVARYLGNAL
jgi:molybdenum cofactor cytidylyltransferase